MASSRDFFLPSVQESLFDFLYFPDPAPPAGSVLLSAVENALGNVAMLELSENSWLAGVVWFINAFLWTSDPPTYDDLDPIKR